MSIRLRLIALLTAMSVLAMGAMTTLFVLGNVVMSTEQARSGSERLEGVAQRLLERAIGDEIAATRLYVQGGDERALAPVLQGAEIERTNAMYLATGADQPEAVHNAATSVAEAAQAWRDGYATNAIRAVRGGIGETARSDQALARDRDLSDSVRAAFDVLDEAIAVDTMARTDTDLLPTIRVAIFAGSIVGGIVALVLTMRALGSLVWMPLRSLVAIARRVEAGEDATFRMHRRDEIGDLAAALERMRHRIHEGRQASLATGAQSSVVNAFTELTAFTSSDAEVAEAMLTAVHELVAPEQAVAHVSNRSRDRATPVAAIGVEGAEALSLHGLEACPGVRRGSLYVTADVSRPLAVRCAVHRPETGTVACVPLMALGETIGAIHLSWAAPDALPVEARTTISRLAEHTALSIGNRRLVNALQGMANTDARTGLPNSRSFDEVVEAAIDRRAAGRRDAILMLDLDHFKMFNDQHGHPAGDEALRAFGGILKSAIRDDDVAARYGGEEFAVYLPDVDIASALEVAERIRARTAETTILIGPGASARISVSIGLAMSPSDGIDRLTLLKAADQALYRAKQGGRNQVAGPSIRDEPPGPVVLAEAV